MNCAVLPILFLIITLRGADNSRKNGLCYYRGDRLEEYIQYRAVRRKLYLLYAMNVADWICTVVLLRSGGFFEVNPFTRAFIDSIPLGLLVKVLLPVVIIAVIIRLMNGLDGKWRALVGGFTSVVIAFYFALCLNHIINFILLIFG